MTNQLEQLIQLQKIDTQIQMLYARLDELPRKLNRHRDELNAIIGLSETIHKRMEQLTKDRHLLELDLKENEETIKKYNIQLYSVKTNDQYKALQHEIALIKEKISKTEDRVLQLMDDLETAKRNWEIEKQKVESGKKVFAEEEQKSSAEENRVKSLLETLETQRTGLISKIEPNLLASYQKISQRWNSMALAQVRGNVCQGCSLTLPPQIVAEVKKNDRIVRCENCARILYMPEEEEEKAEQ